MINIRKYSYANNRLFYKTLISLAIPMGLTSLLGSLLNMIDVLMISNLGDEAVASVGISNKLFFLMNVTLYGVFSGLGVFISQYWGKKDIKRVQTVYMIAVFIGLIVSTIMTLIGFFLPEKFVGCFDDNITVITNGVKYLKIVSLSYIISAILFSIEMVSRSTENVKLPFIVSTIGVATNTILNYLLIYGHFGFKEMGIEGAAYATVISRCLQIFIYLNYIIISNNQVLKLKLSNFIFDKNLYHKIFIKALPVVGNEFIWSLGMISISAAYGKLGTEANASMQTLDTIIGLLTVFTWGVANSSAIMISKKIGENNIEDARWYASLFIFNSVIIGVITGIVIVSCTPLVPFIYRELSDIVINNTIKLLLVFALFMPIKLLAAIFIVGILRSGGDTLFALKVEGYCLWGYAVPMAFILVLFTNLSLPIIFFIVSFEEIIKDVVCFIRFKKGKYIHNLIH